MACPHSFLKEPIHDSLPTAEEVPVNLADAAAAHTRADKQPGNVYYHNYLQLDKILAAQDLESAKAGTPVHDEHLFIVIHQAYELWFKQVLFELDSVAAIFSQDFIEEPKMLVVVQRLNRVVEILKILVDQVKILETMTPMDFVEFRGFLSPASGFQSLQFRLLENKLGMIPENRTKYQQQHYARYFSEGHSQKLHESESEQSASLLKLLEKWLERTPGLDHPDFKFWEQYSATVNRMLSSDRDKVTHNTGLNEEQRNLLLAECEKNELSFASVLNDTVHNELLEKGERRFSHKAFQGALMICLYRDEPRFHLPHQMLNLLIEVDALLTTWRFKHVIMVQRMIGHRYGTGGSSGYQYLRSTISDRYKVFLDLFNMSTWLIPRRLLPALPERLQSSLHYNA